MHPNRNDLTPEEILRSFETMPAIEPGPDWAESLSRKLADPHRREESGGLPHVARAFVWVLLLLNTAFFALQFAHKSSPGAQQDADFALISKQMLINPSAISN